jgi:hypothetical protein
MFGFSAGFALTFQFLAAEGLRYYILGFRHYTQAEISSTYDIKKAEKSLEVRDQRLKYCFLFIMAAAFLLGLGALCMAVAVVLLLYNSEPRPASYLCSLN